MSHKDDLRGCCIQILGGDLFLFHQIEHGEQAIQGNLKIPFGNLPFQNDSQFFDVLRGGIGESRIGHFDTLKSDHPGVTVRQYTGSKPDSTEDRFGLSLLSHRHGRPRLQFVPFK